MNISERMTENELKELLLYVCTLVEKSESLKVKDVVNEIRLQIDCIINSTK